MQILNLPGALEKADFSITAISPVPDHHLANQTLINYLLNSYT